MGSSTLRIARALVYLAWTAGLMPVQGLGLILRRPWVDRLPMYYHRCCCRILGITVRSIGTPSRERPVLFAANHTSYLDIEILGSLIPGSFVAKEEVARWPLFGWLAKLQRSVFVDRRVRSAAAQRDAMARRFDEGDALILFPEGTSGDGNRVLPFKTALFAAVDGRGDRAPVTVQPVSVAYTRLDGIPLGRHYRPFFAWYGAMALMPHLWTMLALGTLEAVVEFHPPTSLAECGSRKALAQYCRARIVGGTRAALSGREQTFADPPGAAVDESAQLTQREWERA